MCRMSSSSCFVFKNHDNMLMCTTKANFPTNLLTTPPTTTTTTTTHYLAMIPPIFIYLSSLFLVFLFIIVTSNLHFLADSIAMNNCESKLSFLKTATTAVHGQFRRHSSQPSANPNAYSKPALLKIGEATALPIMLYHQWIQVQEPTQSDAMDDTKCSDDDQKIHSWTPNKCEDASLHISR